MDVRGGATRDGWYPMGFGNKKLLRNGVAMPAVLERILSMTDNASYDVTIEVKPDGGAPYEVQGLFRVPGDAVGRVKPGMMLPVRVHPSKPMRVAVDWPAWEAEQGSVPDS